VDPAARHASPWFRLLIVPGVAALWPLLLRLWVELAEVRHMIRSQRRLHYRLWMALGPLLLAGMVIAWLTTRHRFPSQSEPFRERQLPAVQWNHHQTRVRRGDALRCGTYLTAFLTLGKLLFTGRGEISLPILMIRGLGTCAILMLHIVLCIGPLARLDKRFSAFALQPKTLGVCTFLVALAHGGAVLVYYGASVSAIHYPRL